ncbi:hypothetical protein CHLNCDRAFT_143882 [Chlorella variabilis]|uniref:Uncharacterized protein n=1 Tax=Chlorella variabilis TaxID=554065 RepID=E1ZAN3_CHLVA|nr:hypothetical protein CHLNCDRAFT_143882 [Chlorella variabilis]EFN57290.1 hypothetical protein CHLNCDRAFT_143882 [Chlorella variabilis]|eukprot:XP_005849392.1 hypothetical protein CHLNCDRAFT_143882 [Chlorella variabilis]
MVLAWEYMRATCCPNLWALDAYQTTRTIFQLCSFVLSLLLSLRMSQGYDRMKVARHAFGNVSSQCTNIVQSVAAGGADAAKVAEFVRWAIVWQYSLLQLVGHDTALAPEAAALLSRGELDLMATAPKPHLVASLALKRLAAGLDPKQCKLVGDISYAIGTGVGSADDCERLRQTPISASLTQLSSGFLIIWLVLLPFGIWAEIAEIENVVTEVVPYILMAILFLGCDEVATQMEDPWPLLPLCEICKAGARDVRRYGTAPNCRGSCPEGWTQIADSDMKNNEKTVSEHDYAYFGSKCITGTGKVLCKLCDRKECNGCSYTW